LRIGQELSYRKQFVRQPRTPHVENGILPQSILAPDVQNCVQTNFVIACGDLMRHTDTGFYVKT